MTRPSALFVNGEKQAKIDFFIQVTGNETNIITIRYNTSLKSCYQMFNGLKNITSINFSNFDSRNVE